LTFLQCIAHALLVKHAEAQHHVKPQHIPPSQSPEEIRLDTAIERASRTQLCRILRQLCAHSKTASEMTREHLTSPLEKVDAPKKVALRSILKKSGSSKRSSQSPRSTPVESTSASNDTPPPSSQIQSQGNAKRKAATQCRNCGCEYNPANADVLACTHHPGKCILTRSAIDLSTSLTTSLIQASEKSTPSTKSGMTSTQTFWVMRGR
jgi:hypothetical protein